LSDTFRIGGSVAKFNRDGFGDNLNLKGVENYNKDVLGARFSAEWEPNEDWFVRLAAIMWMMTLIQDRDIVWFRPMFPATPY